MHKSLYISHLRIAIWHECLAFECLALQTDIKMHGNKSGLYAQYLSLAFSWSWLPWAHGDRKCAAPEFTTKFVLELGVQLLSSLRSKVCTDCVITWFEVQKQGLSSHCGPIWTDSPLGMPCVSHPLVPGPGISYTGPREVLLEFVILVF